jgi:1-acyl-sn-glycerol-3-phosphate acyltransferase
VGDAFYTFVHTVGSAIFWGSSRPVVLHAERTDRRGPFIIAANHHSPYDVPLIIRHSRRKLDFVSIIEVFRHPFVRWFYGSMGAFPIDRSQPDGAGVRTILDRLKNGRAVAMFPEGFIRRPEASVTHGGKFKPGVARLAHMASVEVMPCVVVNSGVYGKVSSWLPLKRIRYGVIFGEPIALHADLDKSAALAAMESELKDAFINLYRELTAKMEKPESV